MRFSWLEEVFSNPSITSIIHLLFLSPGNFTLKQNPWVKMANQVTQMATIYWTNASNCQFYEVDSNNYNDLSCPGIAGEVESSSLILETEGDVS